MCPLRFRHTGGRNLHSYLIEDFACYNPIHRVVAQGQPVFVSVAQFKARPEFGHRGTKILNPLNAVHPERGLIRPGNRLVRLDQDDAITQTGDDKLQLVMANLAEGMVLGHGASLSEASTLRNVILLSRCGKLVLRADLTDSSFPGLLSRSCGPATGQT
jgi:hypothetical protein